MAEATNPITTASNPRVGEDVFGGFDSADYKPDLASAIAAEIMGLGWALPEYTGDEDEEAEEQTRRHGQVQSIVEAALSRSGKLVAPTGSGEETKGAVWRPIETAPRTFQPILLDLGRGKHGDIGRAPVIGVWSDFCGGWAFWGAPKVPVSPQPIRWHVLPSPPEAPSDAPSTPEADR